MIEDDRPKRWQHSRVGVLAIAKLFEDDSFIETLRDHLGRAVSLTGITEQEIIDAEFEGKYAEAMRVEHGKIRIFGLDLSRSHGRGLDLETAYLSLEALSSPNEYQREVEAISKSARVETILEGKRRILLRGHAGSGKSTLMQWIAIKSISGSLSEELSALNNRVPFMLRLRAMYRLDNLRPSPDQFLEIGNIPVANEQPTGWADRVLREGRALLLVDGMDEIPDEKRDEAKEWLGWILDHYPGAWVLVTVRPSAVPRSWLRDYGFDELALLPMSRRDRSVFIKKWHEAAVVESSSHFGAASPERERANRELRELHENLLRTLEVTPQLAALTDSPLLCAMICALHRDRNGALPSGRMEIYRAALGMLLARRDQQRKVELELEEDEHRALLQEIAAWLVGEGLVQGGKADAVNQIQRMLPSLYRINRKFSAEQLYDHIVERSGLLTETTTETFEFIHRTFQDYLAAQEFKEARNFRMLASRAHEEQWEDVIRMAVGHCDHRDRAMLLREIVGAGDSAPDESTRRSVHLVAGSCLPYSTRLDTNIRNLVLDRVCQHLPKDDVQTDVNKLASVGDDLISILPSADAKPWVIAVLGEIRSEHAFEALKVISESANVSILNQIASVWNSFDTEKFAKQLLAKVDCSKVSFWVYTNEQLKELRGLVPVGSLTVDGIRDWSEAADLLRNLKTKDIAIFNGTNLRNLDFLRDMEEIVLLEIFGCWGLEDLSSIRSLQLRALDLVDVIHSRTTASQLADILSSQDEIREIGLGAPELELLDPACRFPQISDLKLWYPERGVATLRHVAHLFPGMRHLTLFLAHSERGRVIDLSSFADRRNFTVDIRCDEKPTIRGKHLFAPENLEIRVRK
ncbi:NACHT domain-containing protein [Streptomyces sp. NBC_00203]|uniref:NACHT domain-containing protein n=1 Tax=Streptomyces sp. NBC_00203 TaxID=2975680 RepID=UPI003247C7FA